MKQVIDQRGPYVFVLDTEVLPGMHPKYLYGSEFQLIYLGESVVLLEGVEIAWRYRGTPLVATDGLMQILHPGETVSLLTHTYLHKIGNERMARQYAMRDQHVPVNFPIEGEIRVALHFRNPSGPTDPASILLMGMPYNLHQDETGSQLYLGYDLSPEE